MKQTKQAGAAALPKSGYFAMVCILIAGSLWGCLGLFNRHLSALGSPGDRGHAAESGGLPHYPGLIFLVYDRSIFRIRLRHLPIFLCSLASSAFSFLPSATSCSQQVSSLAVAAILLYTAPTFVVILSALLWKDRITKRKLAALVLAFLGCCFVAGILNGALTLTPEGLLLGIGSGLFYSSYTIFGRFALKHYQPFTVTFYTFLIAGIGSLFMTSPGDLSTTFHSPMGILLSLGLMVVGTVIPYLLYTKGLSDLGDSGKASILASVEPVVASLVGIAAFGEPMTLGVVLGLVCILASVYILR